MRCEAIGEMRNPVVRNSSRFNRTAQDTVSRHTVRKHRRRSSSELRTVKAKVNISRKI